MITWIWLYYSIFGLSYPLQHVTSPRLSSDELSITVTPTDRHNMPVATRGTTDDPNLRPAIPKGPGCCVEAERRLQIFMQNDKYDNGARQILLFGLKRLKAIRSNKETFLLLSPLSKCKHCGGKPHWQTRNFWHRPSAPLRPRDYKMESNKLFFIFLGHLFSLTFRAEGRAPV